MLHGIRDVGLYGPLSAGRERVRNTPASGGRVCPPQPELWHGVVRAHSAWWWLQKVYVCCFLVTCVSEQLAGAEDDGCQLWKKCLSWQCRVHLLPVHLLSPQYLHINVAMLPVLSLHIQWNNDTYQGPSRTVAY